MQEIPKNRIHSPNLVLVYSLCRHFIFPGYFPPIYTYWNSVLICILSSPCVLHPHLSSTSHIVFFYLLFTVSELAWYTLNSDFNVIFIGNISKCETWLSNCISCCWDVLFYFYTKKYCFPFIFSFDVEMFLAGSHYYTTNSTYPDQTLMLTKEPVLVSQQ